MASSAPSNGGAPIARADLAAALAKAGLMASVTPAAAAQDAAAAAAAEDPEMQRTRTARRLYVGNLAPGTDQGTI